MYEVVIPAFAVSRPLETVKPWNVALAVTVSVLASPRVIFPLNLETPVTSREEVVSPAANLAAPA
jgi:hypothetical protein